MELSEKDLELLQNAMRRFGATGLARKLNISRNSLYSAIQRKSGLNHLTLQVIAELMQSQVTQTAASAPSVAIAPVQSSSPSDTAEIDRLLAIELHKLSIEDKRKVYRYVVELQVKRQAEEP